MCQSKIFFQSQQHAWCGRFQKTNLMLNRTSLEGISMTNWLENSFSDF